MEIERSSMGYHTHSKNVDLESAITTKNDRLAAAVMANGTESPQVVITGDLTYMYVFPDKKSVVSAFNRAKLGKLKVDPSLYDDARIKLVTPPMGWDYWDGVCERCQQKDSGSC